MNEVFLIGKIITDIEFKFIIDSKNISISTFAIETIENKEKIELKAYNEIADFAFQNLVKENIVIINGYIDNDNKIAIKEINQIKAFTNITKILQKSCKNVTKVI